jgi:hypothetical protein
MWIKARSWNSIIEFYAGMVENGWQYQSMLNFVQQLAASLYILNPPITLLFPALSMDVLLIAATDGFFWKTEVLEIRYSSPTQTFHFDFWESEFIEPHWMCKSNISNSFATFERFLHLKRWA